MSFNDNAVLTAAVGYAFVGAVGTAAPTPAELATLNLEDPSSWTTPGWDSAGHTSRNDLPEVGYEGGDSEIKGTWQKKKLREVNTDDPIDYLTLHLQQFDSQSLGLYYGENTSDVPGEFGVSADQSGVNERAILVIIEDGEVRLGIYAAKSSVKRDDAVQLAIDEFGSLPVRFTFLDNGTKTLFKWISEDLLQPVVTEYTVALGGPSGGTFTLTYGGNVTDPIAHDATSAAVKAALVALDDGYKAADWTVTGSNGGPFTVETPGGALSGSGTGLTGGTFSITPVTD